MVDRGVYKVILGLFIAGAVCGSILTGLLALWCDF